MEATSKIETNKKKLKNWTRNYVINTLLFDKFNYSRFRIYYIYRDCLL